MADYENEMDIRYIMDSLLLLMITKLACLINIFASAGIADNGKSVQTLQVQYSSILESIVFNEQTVLIAICKLNPNLSSGPDGLPQCCSSNCSLALLSILHFYSLSYFLLVLYQRSGSRLLSVLFSKKVLLAVLIALFP